MPPTAQNLSGSASAAHPFLDDSDGYDIDYDTNVAQQQVHDSDEGESISDELQPIEPDKVSGLLEGLAPPPSDNSTQPTLASSEPFNRLLLAHLTRPPVQPLTRSAYATLAFSFSLMSSNGAQ